MKKTHEWITLENPRNGTIKVQLCTLCGNMKLPSGSNSECNGKSLRNHRPLAGWKQTEVAA